MLNNGLITEESEGLLPDRARDICSSVIVHTDSTAYAASHSMGTGWFNPWGLTLYRVFHDFRA